MSKGLIISCKGNKVTIKGRSVMGFRNRDNKAKIIGINISSVMRRKTHTPAQMTIHE